MANEKLRKDISKLHKTEICENVFDNPVIKNLISFIPAFGTGIDSAIHNVLKEEQDKRLQRICEIIISDNQITTNQINDVKDIVSFIKMLDVARKLITNDKLEYLARLYKNLIIEEEKNYNLYEEYLRRLDELSFREIEILHTLDDLDLVIQDLGVSNYTENKAIVERNYQNKVDKIEEKWINFQEIVQQKIGIDKLDLVGYMMSISRSGFCVKFNVFQTPIRTNSIYGITKYYRKFAEMIYK